MIILFLIGFILGILYAFIGEKLPLLVPEVKKAEPNSWIFNLFIGVVNGLVLIISYIGYGLCYEFYLSVIIAALFFIIFISDFKYMIILDSPLLIGSILILVLKYIYFDLKTVGISVLSGIILFLLMLGIGYIGKKAFKKEALGGGDIKLAFTIGIILSLRLGLISIILSSLMALPYALGSIMLNSNKEVPYGPFMISSLVLVFVFSDKFGRLISLL